VEHTAPAVLELGLLLLLAALAGKLAVADAQTWSE
jgi:hypothetical protein